MLWLSLFRTTVRLPCLEPNTGIRQSLSDMVVVIGYRLSDLTPMGLTPKTRATNLAHRRRQGSLCSRGTLCRNGNDHVDVIATDNLFYEFS
jgi:hypothetical protein